MFRRLAWLLAFFALSFPHDARAVDFTDARDAFTFTIDPPGMPACVTYPPERFDRVECDGLDPAREAAERATTLAGTQWVGASVFRGDSWGFRLSITRADVPPGATGESADLALLRDGRDWVNRTLKQGQLVGGEAGLSAELRVVNEIRVARLAFAFKADGVGVLQSIVYVVPSELGMYTVTLLSDRAHAAELEKIADLALPSLHVRPRPRFPPLVAALLLYGVLPTVVLFGVVFLIARLASIRRGRTAAVSWPGLRGDERP